MQLLRKFRLSGIAKIMDTLKAIVTHAKLPNSVFGLKE